MRLLSVGRSAPRRFRRREPSEGRVSVCRQGGRGVEILVGSGENWTFCARRKVHKHGRWQGQSRRSARP